MNFKRKSSFIITMVIISAIILTFGLTASAGTGYGNPTSNDPQAYLAEIYSQHFGVSLEEASLRLRLQDGFPGLSSELEKNEVETFGGLWIQHTPEYKIVVSFTDEGVKTLNKYNDFISKDVMPYVEVITVDRSLADLLNDQAKLFSSLGEQGIKIESRVDVKNNCVSIDIVKSDKDRYDLLIQNEELPIPDRLKINIVDGLSIPTTDIYGGLELDYYGGSPSSTSGFAVKHNTTGVEGVLNATHCSNYLYYDGTSLTWAGSAEGGSYDVQWHTNAGLDVEPKFQWWDDEDYTFDVTSVLMRSQQDVGRIVSKYGRSTHYTAGELTSKTTTRAIPYNSPTWMEVDNIFSYDKLIDQGDSGGPWFNGNIALGISSGATIDFNTAYYMAFDYLDLLNLSVMTD